MEHSHHHTHDCGTRCCGGHHHQTHCSGEALALLQSLAHGKHTPVVQFVLHSTKSEHLEAVALTAVHLTAPDNTQAEVKARGGLLHELEESGLIVVDYDQPCPDADYACYHASDVYRQFMDTAAEAAKRPDFLYDIGKLECGTITLTEQGQALAAKGTP